MAKIDFGDTIEGAVTVLKGFADRVNADLYGNGRTGFVERVLKFMDRFEAEEAERERQQERQHRENTQKLDEISLNMSRKSLWWTVAGVIAAVAGLALTVCAILASFYIARHYAESPPQLFHSTEANPVLSSTQTPETAIW